MTRGKEPIQNMSMGSDTEFEGYANHAGEARVRAWDWKGSANLTLRQAQELHHALGLAIDEARAAEQRFQNQVASLENEAAQ